MAWAEHCGSNVYAWPDCEDPTIIVMGDISFSEGGVEFGGADGNGGRHMTIHALPNSEGGPGILSVWANGSHVGTVTVTSHVATGVSLGLNVTGHVGGVVMDTASQIEWLWLKGEVGGNLGTVSASGMGGPNPLLETFTVNGDIDGNISLIDRVDDSDVRIWNLLVEGDILGGVTIWTESGGIGQVLVKGAIGESGDPVTILSGMDITSIVTGEMFADIVVMHEESSVTYWGNIRELRTDKSLDSGDFVGTIQANSVGNPVERSLELTPAVGPQIDIQGNLGDGVVPTYLWFASALAFDGTFHNAQIVVGNDFLDGSTIEMPSAGLEGQIIINRDDDSGIWESGAEIIVGATTLTAPDYMVTAQSLGGGAAGLAPFDFHYESCDPPATSSTAGEMELVGELDLVGFELVCVFPNPPVDIQFKGGVGRFTSASGLPVIVEKYAGGDVWTDISNSFGFSMSPGGDYKKVRLTRSLGWVDGSYRVRRRTGHLYCAEVADEETEIGDFAYYFDVIKIDCEGSLLASFDLNLDTVVSEPGDMPSWFLSPVDFNDDSTTDADDIAILESAATLYGETPSSPVYFTGPWTLVE